MFIGRKNELSKLEKLYKTDKFQLPVIYGRRRIGKTALINEFIKNKPHISFTAIESSRRQNIENLSKSILSFSNFDSGEAFPVFDGFHQALEYIFKIAQNQRLIFVMDEYPYAAKCDNTLSSVLQSLIDKYHETSRLFLILCGSSMSFMEEQVLGYESPLYGRRTAQFKINPFTFMETLEYFGNYDKHDAAYLYGVCGGTPQYFLQLDTHMSVRENIIENVLDTSSYLFEEPQNLLKQEVREASLYNSIISAIASGSTKLSEIASKTGEETSACSAVLKKLIALGLVVRETPFGEKEGRKSLYIISDNLFRFWYRFVPGNISALQNDMAEAVYRLIENQLHSYMGDIFEDICRQYLWQMNRRGQLPFVFTDLGRWWGTDPSTRQQEEIDIVASDGNSAVFCECKWRNELTEVSVLDRLAQRSTLLPYSQKYLYLFSKSAFSDACIEAAGQRGNVTLITFSEMF